MSLETTQLPEFSFPEFIDSSSRSAFVSCPRKWALEYGLHRKQRRASIHLRAGGAFAAGLEAARIAHWGEGKSPAESLTEGCIALIRHYGEEDGQAVDEGSAKTLETLLLALDDYFRHHGWTTDSVQPLMLDGKPAVEFSFALPMEIAHPVTGNPLLYTGRFDMLGEFNGVLWAVDEKTTGQLGPSWSKRWHMRGQLIGYCYAARQFGHRVGGALIRGVSVQTREIKHAEVPVYVKPHLLNLWWHQLHLDAGRMINCWRSAHFDYNLGDACASYGGCNFLSACESPQPMRWIEAETVYAPWNPLNIGDAA